MTGRESLLTSILNCGTLDLRLLDDVQYDWCEILEHYDGEKTLNGLMRAVFRYGFGEIEQAVNNRICELDAIPNERELDDDEEKELAALKELSPHDDFDSFHNYLDTHVYCEQHGGTYKAYMSDALDGFENNTGFCISIIEEDE